MVLGLIRGINRKGDKVILKSEMILKSIVVVVGVGMVVGCGPKQYVSSIGLENIVEKQAVSYDSRTVEYVEKLTPVSWIKHVEYVTSGETSPQIKQVLAFYCIKDMDDVEECQMIAQPYAASGSGLMNDVLGGVGAATVGAAGFVGGSYLFRPDNTNNTTNNTTDVQQDGGDVSNSSVALQQQQQKATQQLRNNIENDVDNRNSNNNSNVNRNVVRKKAWMPKKK